MSLREISSLLGVLCVCALLWRSIPNWPEMTWLERGLAVLMGFSIAIGAVGSFHLDRVNAAASGVVWWVLADRVLTLALCVVWPLWMGRGGLRRIS